MEEKCPACGEPLEVSTDGDCCNCGELVKPPFGKGDRVTFEDSEGGQVLHGTVQAAYPKTPGGHYAEARVHTDDGRSWSVPQWRLDREEVQVG